MGYQFHSVWLLALALAGPTWASEPQTVKLVLGAKGFEPPQIEISAGASFRLEVTNQSSEAGEFESFDLNRERVMQPGQTVSVYVSGLQPGQYEFFDDFNQTRRGVLIVK